MSSLPSGEGCSAKREPDSEASDRPSWTGGADAQSRIKSRKQPCSAQTAWWIQRISLSTTPALRAVLLPLLLLAMVCPAWGQRTTERDHFQVKIGATYDQGDFGSTETTKVLYVPITFRYLGDRYDVSVTPSFARVKGPGGIRLIDGVPTPTGEQSGSLQERSAAGDTVVRGRYYLVEENGLNVSPFIKVKIPTAPDDLNLGTGKTDYGFGIEVDKQIDSVLVFGDLSYTFTGKIPTLRMRNRTGASFGIGKNVSDSLLLSGMVDWRQSLIAQNPDPTELVGILTYKALPRVTISPNAYVGLNNSSADFGFGIEIGFRFWRY